MGTQTRSSLPLILQCILFLIPVNIYVIGDSIAAGIQWVFFRYQQSYLGNSLIVFSRDLYYIQAGLLTGKSAVAAEAGVVATCIMVFGVLLLLVAYRRQSESGRWVKAGAVFTICGGCVYLVSDIIQYGIFFHGPSGFVIPVGVPAIILAGGWIYRMDFTDAGTEEEADEPEVIGGNENS